MQHRQQLLGGFTWLSIFAAAGLAIHSQFSDKPQGVMDVLSGMGRWVTGEPKEYAAVSAVKLVLAPGDPVFLKMPDGAYRQVGRVRNHFGPVERIIPAPGKIAPLIETPTQKATVVIYDDVVRRAFPDGFMLEYHTTPTALDWVVRTMITPQRQKEIAQLIAADWERHREQILSRLQPVLETSIARTVAAIETELPAVLNSHQADFAKLADRYQSEIVRREIVPLVREEILPIVQEEVRPLATDLGKQLWDRVSLWSFTWRYLYDVSPLPEKNAVKLEFDRFLRDEVTPALEARSNDFVLVTESILRRISRNAKVRSVIRQSLNKVATDRDLQTIVWSIVQASVIENQTLRTSLRDYWTSPEVQDAMQIATSSFEPTARAVGDAIFGSRESGITPEFSRVLRAQILMKDRRWLVLVPKSSQPVLQPVPVVDELIMFAAEEPMPFPIEFEGTEQSPLTQLQSPLPETSAP